MKHNGVDMGPTPPANAGTFTDSEGKVFRLAPHPWDKRKQDVLRTYAQRILAFIEPFGFAKPMHEHTPISRIEEIGWLIETQEREIAPEYMRLVANGIEAVSINETREGEDGEVIELVQTIDEDTVDEFYGVIDANRIEPFLRAEDERQWYTGLPKRFFWGSDIKGNVGLAPGNQRTTLADCKEMVAIIVARGDVPTLEEVHAAYAARASQEARKPTQAQKDALDAWFDKFDPYREEFRVADEQERYNKDRHTYAPSSPCPDIERGKCVNGRSLVEITTSRKHGRTIFLKHYGPCRTCNGSKVIPHTLGLHEDGELLSTAFARGR